MVTTNSHVTRCSCLQKMKKRSTAHGGSNNNKKKPKVSFFLSQLRTRPHEEVVPCRRVRSCPNHLVVFELSPLVKNCKHLPLERGDVLVNLRHRRGRARHRR